MKKESILIPYEGNEHIYAGFLKVAKEIAEKQNENPQDYKKQKIEISA